MASGSELVIQLTNTKATKSPGTYTIYIYTDGAMTTLLAQSPELAEDGAGVATWASGLILESNRSYYWKWTGVFTSGSNTSTSESDLMPLYVQRDGAMNAIAPRSGGYLNLNNAAYPRLAVKNVYTQGDASISYDFELFYDAALTAPITNAYGAAQNGEDTYTYVDVSIPATSADAGTPGLLNNTSYFWRARAVVNGVAQEWSQVYSFTVRDFCELGSGGSYAAWVVDWTHDYNCDQLLRTDPNQALGAPNAAGFVDQDNPGYGFISMDIGGTMIFEMGSTIWNGGGYDVRVYQYWSQEPIEVFAAQSEAGPWYSLGWSYCGYSFPGEEYGFGHCDFDLGAAGLQFAKYIKVLDKESPTCYQTAGAEIDAVVALYKVDSSRTCTTPTARTGMSTAMSVW